MDKDTIRQVWGQWIDSLASWQWFATFTFADPDRESDPSKTWTKIGWRYALNALTAWHNALTECFPLDKLVNPLWVACMEYQGWRGVPHWHLLVGGLPEDTRRMDWVDWWWDHYGIARILPYQRELGASYYLTKYVTKELADIRFSPGLRMSRNSLDTS